MEMRRVRSRGLQNFGQILLQARCPARALIKEKMFIRSFILIITALLFTMPANGQDKKEDASPKEDDQLVQKTKRPPIVVMKQSHIQGKVFFLTQEDDNDAVADNLLIELSSLDDNRVIHSTATDTNGVYTLPDLDRGNYGLNIGRLKMELIVEDPTTTSRQISTLPKNIIVFIPRAMEKKAENKKRR